MRKHFNFFAISHSSFKMVKSHPNVFCIYKGRDSCGAARRKLLLTKQALTHVTHAGVSLICRINVCSNGSFRAEKQLGVSLPHSVSKHPLLPGTNCSLGQFGLDGKHVSRVSAANHAGNCGFPAFSALSFRPARGKRSAAEVLSKGFQPPFH